VKLGELLFDRILLGNAAQEGGRAENQGEESDQARRDTRSACVKGRPLPQLGPIIGQEDSRSGRARTPRARRCPRNPSTTLRSGRLGVP
jgi:hypothetical protein